MPIKPITYIRAHTLYIEEHSLAFQTKQIDETEYRRRMRTDVAYSALALAVKAGLVLPPEDNFGK
jgi:hypothetical protein